MVGTDVFLLTKPAGSNSIQRACTQAISNQENFAQKEKFVKCDWATHIFCRKKF
jgi:hypothetical protein